MRATFSGLNTMVRGIIANQLSLDTTGHNITNAGNDGYSRQVVTLARTHSESRAGLHGQVRVGTGVDVLSVERARNIYADILYRNENPSQQYFKTRAVNYDKLETIFDDSKNLGIEAAINKFYQSWVELSTSASTSATRTNVIEQGRNLSDVIQTATAELQEQIRNQYEDIKSEVLQVEDILEGILSINKQIIPQEAAGATANDLRDERDKLVDKLSDYVNITVTEDEFGAYQINSGGVTLVNRQTRSHLVMSDGVSSSMYGIDYGITDYSMKIKESNVVFLPQNGILKARLDSIAEDKAYIDELANLSMYMLTALNDQHKQGWDIRGDYKFVDANGNKVNVADETQLVDVNYLQADGSAVDTADEANITIRDGKYYLNGAEVTKYEAGTKYTYNNNVLTKIPDTINFYGKDSIDYQYRYDAEYDRNYLYKDDPELAEADKLLSGVRIIAELEVNSIFNQNRGDRYLAAATSINVEETLDANGNIQRAYMPKAWGDRTGDGTNAVYMSELFNISHDTIISDGKANALLAENYFLRDLDGNLILDAGGNTQLATSTSRLSINSYYQKAVSTLGIDAYSTDVNYEATQAIMTQVTNWRDSTAGVDWNEELTNMIKFQKGFVSCSRCLNAMDECLDRLVNSTGVVGR